MIHQTETDHVHDELDAAGFQFLGQGTRILATALQAVAYQHDGRFPLLLAQPVNGQLDGIGDRCLTAGRDEPNPFLGAGLIGRIHRAKRNYFFDVGAVSPSAMAVDSDPRANICRGLF